VTTLPCPCLMIVFDCSLPRAFCRRDGALIMQVSA
jgi:hypothetical protein